MEFAGRPNKKGEVLLTGEYAQGWGWEGCDVVLDECGGAGEEGESEASGEQDRIDRQGGIRGEGNKKEGGGAIRIVLGLAALQKKRDWWWLV